ncbi:MAG: sensor domain-containing diguanylate cyclase [Sideroxydans sp.]|nr:sensor domain-containing diguanylate cyclase [Sideroxydans sp.]
MQAPHLPSDEAARLTALHALNILDTAHEERFDRVTRMAKRMFGVSAAFINLVDEKRVWIKSCEGLTGITEAPRDISFCGHAILGDASFIINDALTDQRFADNPAVAHPPGVRFYAGHPLKAHNGKKIGTLCIIDTEPKVFAEEDISALQDLAAMVEMELSAMHMANMDELTDITNRRGFIMLAQHDLYRCIRYQLPACLIFMDLKKFKQINDTFGHAEGDKALVNFADQMKRIYRESDIFARLGGDEFVAMLSNSTQAHAQHLLERFSQSLTQFNQHQQRGYDLLFSYGIVSVDVNKHHSIEALLHDADTLMYQHKQAS